MANLIAYVLHPLLMPSYTFILLMWLAPPALRPIGENLYFNIMLIVSITSLLIPLLMMSTLRVTLVIPNFHLEEKKQRIVPFFFVFIIYAVSTYMFYSQFNFAKLFYVAYLATSLLIFILTVITIFWKISFHSAAIAGVFGILYAIQMKFPELDLLYMLAALLVVSGLVGASRLSLQLHNYKQVIIGYLVGFVNCYLIVWLML